MEVEKVRPTVLDCRMLRRDCGFVRARLGEGLEARLGDASFDWNRAAGCQSNFVVRQIGGAV